MAKRINPNELIGTCGTNKKGHKFSIVSYLGKEKDYMYKVRFESGELIKASRQQILKLTLRDLITEKKEKDKKKFLDYKRKNVAIEKTTIYVDDKSKTRLLSIDQSTKASGWAVYYDNQLIDCGVFKQNSANTMERISNTRKDMIKIIKEHKINVVVFEDIYLNKNIHVYKVLAFLLGVLCTTLYDAGIVYDIIPAPEWKGYHNILKGDREMQKLLSKRKFNADSDDISDALLIGMYAWNEVIVESGW
ncbi:MAG: hypothetical protein ACRDD8_05255 [Bacteroidales bacterium]